MDKNTKKKLLNVIESVADTLYYSSLFGIAFTLIVNGLGVHIENVILSLVGFWFLFMLIEIMWTRCKNQIREMLNEKNK
jgi:predicted tellurium resistance membrane protein TerC